MQISDDRIPEETISANGRPGSYSLLLLFYLTTMAAIVAATSRLAFDNKLFTWSSFALGTLITALLSISVGSVVGYLCVGRGALGPVVGAIVAVALSPVAAWISLVGADHFASANAIVWGGCWLIITISMLGNRLQTAAVRR
jgi:hypothetical protein